MNESVAYAPCDCPEGEGLTRRRLLAAAGLAGAIGVTGARFSFAAAGPKGDTLVFVFLRGGMDGLSVVAPVGDPEYAKKRPTIAVPKSVAIPLDRLFGMHPNMAPLKKAWDARDLAVVHATGEPDGTRSHFEAQDSFERGVAADSGIYTGWIDRAFTSRPSGLPPFPSVAIGSAVPVSMRGPAPDFAVQQASDFRIQCPPDVEKQYNTALGTLYADVAGNVGDDGRRTIRMISLLAARRGKVYEPANGAVYPANTFGQRLQEVASFIKSGSGLEAAAIDLDGWDLHAAAGGPSGGLMADMVTTLAGGLGAFYTDLGSAMNNITVVALSEFGRTPAENGSAGTDHGYGNCMFVMGGGIRGGKVYARWPGLGAKQLDDRGDLRVTIDYRDVLADVVMNRMGNSRVGDVFPGHRARPLGLADKR